jgi:drug/metabolite transporter (DMT)-like permease
VVVSFGGYGLYNYALSKVEASQAAGFTNLIPLFSLILGYLLLGETLNSSQLFGCGLIFLGVVGAFYRQKSRG